MRLTGLLMVALTVAIMVTSFAVVSNLYLFLQHQHELEVNQLDLTSSSGSTSTRSEPDWWNSEEEAEMKASQRTPSRVGPVVYPQSFVQYPRATVDLHLDENFKEQHYSPEVIIKSHFRGWVTWKPANVDVEREHILSSSTSLDREGQ